jgi:hypothetical protein
MTDNSLMTDEYIKNMRLLSWILFSELKDVKLSTYEYDLWDKLDVDIKNSYTFDSDKSYIENENNEVIKGYQKDYIEINGVLYHKKEYNIWDKLDVDIKNSYTFDSDKRYIKNENNEIIKGYQKNYIIKIHDKFYKKKETSEYGYFKYKIIRNIQDFNDFKFRQDAIHYFNNFYLKINENLETEDGDIKKENLLNKKGVENTDNNYLYKKDSEDDKSYRYLYNKNKKDDLISYYIDYSNLKDYEIIIDMINDLYMINYFKIYIDVEDIKPLKKFVSKNLKNDKIDFNEKANDKYLGKPLFKNSLYIMDIIAILSTILLMFFIYFIKEDYNTNIYIVSGILIIIAIIYVFFSILLYN